MNGPPQGTATEFGAILRAHRRTAGLTQQELATRAGMSLAAVRDLEQGRRHRPRPDSVTRLAGALGLAPTETQQLVGARETAPAMTGADSTDPARQRRSSGDIVRLGVLGPLTARRGNTPMPVGSPGQRVALGLLALAANTPVHRETIIDAVWGQHPPVSAVNVVQAHVSRLRQLLDPGRRPHDPGGLLVSFGTSYQLRIAAEHLDVLAFARLTTSARAAAASGELSLACSRYERALGLWRGEPLADVETLREHPAVTALASSRTTVLAEYAEVACEAGWYDRVLPSLLALAAREPLDERVHARLLTALAGAGRRAEALRVYERLRRRLDEELGVYPGAELVQAHARLLTDAASADIGVGQDGVSVRGHTVPRHLPRAPTNFVGRAGELATLSALADQSAGTTDTAVICAIDGTAGCGKTALAVHWAHRAAGRFPDGQLYLDLRGFSPSGPPVTPEDAVRGFLHALDVPPERVPAGLDAQTALYRSRLVGRRMLIVLDNARSAEHVRPLLPGTPSCMVVVTSRGQLAGLIVTEGAERLCLDVLGTVAARELLSARLGAQRIAREPDPVTELIGLCARLPLALCVVAARAAAYPDATLATAAAELRHPPTRLDTLDAGSVTASVRAVFSWSYRELTDPAARMFRLLSAHPGPDISTEAAASLIGGTRAEARQALTELTGAHLLTEHSPHRYTSHDLLRVYATERAVAQDGAQQRRAAICRLLDHYLHTAHAAEGLLNPQWERTALGPPPAGVTPERLADADSALSWFEAERTVLLAASNHAAACGFDTHAWQLPWACKTFLDRRGYWHETVAVLRPALACAKRLDDRAAQGNILRCLGNACAQAGYHDEAGTHLEAGLGLYRALGDKDGEISIRLNLSQACERRDQYGEALSHAEHALGLATEMGSQLGSAKALNAIGWCHTMLGNHQAAVTYCQQAIELCHEVGHQVHEAAAWHSLGCARHRLGQYTLAVEAYQRALALHHDLGDSWYRAYVLADLGETHHANGDPEAAREAWQEALHILDDLNRPDADVVRAKLRHLPSNQRTVE
ncbi:MAG TPA: BTAD domain-containing putative transcriptional regulator [Pseudonocardiaceae bacterium]